MANLSHMTAWNRGQVMLERKSIAGAGTNIDDPALPAHPLQRAGAVIAHTWRDGGDAVELAGGDDGNIQIQPCA